MKIVVSLARTGMFIITLMALLVGCGGPTATGPVNITYSYPSFASNANIKNLRAVQDAINVILKEKLNATVTLKPIDQAAYDQKMKLAFSARQDCDVVFTAPWTNNFYQNVANGNLLPIDDLLQKHAPGLYASMTPETWNAAKVDGKIHGVINQQPFTRRFGPRIREDLANKYGLDLSTVNTYKDLEPFLEAVKKGEPEVTPLGTGSLYNPAILGLDVIDGTDVDTGVLTVRVDDKSRKVINAATLPEFKELMQLSRKWYQAGYYPQTEPANYETQVKAGEFAGEIFVVNPDSTAELKNSYGFDYVTKALGTPILTTGGINATMNGICRASEHPEVAMKFLELLNTDKDVYRLIAHGIEGKDYVVVDKENDIIDFPSGVTAETVGYDPNTPWMFGNLFNSYYRDPRIVGAWEEMREINASATPSVMLGFSFTPDKVKSQLAVLATVHKQYGEPLRKGLVDPETKLPEYIDKMKAAGVDEVIAEIQAQIDEWAKTQK